MMPVCPLSWGKNGLTIIKLTVGLFTVNDVKPISNIWSHSTDFKVKPLMIMITIYIRVQNKIVFISENRK